MKCIICESKNDSNATCTNGHYICDKCPQTADVDFTENVCLNSNSKNPLYFDFLKLFSNKYNSTYHKRNVCKKTIKDFLADKI